MKVDIKNRHERTGMLRKTDHYWVDVTVTFSEEEKQIIKQHKKEWLIIVEREHRDGPREAPSSLLGKAAALAMGPNDGHLRVKDLLKGTDSFDCPDPLAAREYQEEVVKQLRTLKAYLEAQAAGTEDTTIEI